jgi:hypothetical protein
MFYKRSQHTYPDGDLINALALAQQCGVSCAAITKAKQSNRIDSFENSKGKECFHRVLSAIQFQKSRDRRHVTTATSGQKHAGFDNEMAQAVAHRPEFDNPNAAFSAERDVDFSVAMAETMDLATSKAKKEFNLAKLAELKAAEMEGRLVPKNAVAVKVYQLAANVQDKILTMYSWLAPEIVGYFKDRCGQVGIDQDKTLQIFDDADHAVGEKIRKACLTSLKDIASKTVENILE